MRRLAAAWVLTLACDAGPSSAPPHSASSPSSNSSRSDNPPQRHGDAAPPPEAAALQAKPAVSGPALDADTAPSLCVRMCEYQGQARAIGADEMRRDCARRCETKSDDCGSADAARARVEAVAMKSRATLVWAELAKPGFFCGYGDPFTRGLDNAATADLSVRADALARSLRRDPFFDVLCPTQAMPSRDATATDAIVECGLADPGGAWHDDVDAWSFLAIRGARLRLEALGLDTTDRNILLDTLTLSTALTHEQ